MNFESLKLDVANWANRGGLLDSVLDTLVEFGQEHLEQTLKIPALEASPAGTAYLAEGNNRITLPADYAELKYLCFTDALIPPTNATHTSNTGSLGAGTYYYRVSAINSDGGETHASVETSIVLGAGGGVNVNWTKVDRAIGYKVYGRSTGAQALIATVGDVATYHDTGIITPAGALPTNNTSGRTRHKQVKRYDNQDFVNLATAIGVATKGRPLNMERAGDEFIFDRYAEQDHVYELRYYKKLSALSATNLTNWWTDNAQKALLYAVLAETKDFLENDPRVEGWARRRDEEIRLLEVNERDEMSSGMGRRPYSINQF